jgi:predicted DsbA family dithiol-disulfide isomerase
VPELSAGLPDHDRYPGAPGRHDAPGVPQLHDYLYEHQSHLDEAHLLQYARDIGLDTARFERHLESHAFAPRVREDFQSGVRSGVNGTPTFFINGFRHDGEWDLATLTSAILAAAEKR